VIAARSRANNDGVKLLLIAHTRGFAQSGAFPTKRAKRPLL
jgi:hypothetical protein